MKYYYLGCDVSKGYADFIILNHHKKTIVSAFQLDDTPSGHQEFKFFLGRFFKNRTQSILFIGVESTGGYENNWYDLFCLLRTSFPLRVTRLNPAGVKYHSKSSLQRVETDKTSSRTIADYLITHSDIVRYDEEDDFMLLRRHFKFITLLKKQKTQLLNHLESLLYCAYPEIIQYCSSGVPQWVLKLLTTYPTARTVSQASVQALNKIPYLSRARAEQLITEASESIASAQSVILEALIQGVVVQIQSLNKTIATHEALLAKEHHPPEVDLLKTIPGISDYSALGLLIEIGFINDFTSAKKLACYFGIHPAFKESGDGMHRMKMSKQGRSRARGILFLNALSAVQSDPHLAAVYASYLHRGMPRMAALGVMMHKLTRIIYGVLKSKTPYNPAIDRNHQVAFHKRQQSCTTPQRKKERRYHKLDPAAPVSRRQRKKRKEQKASQTGNVPAQRGITSAHSHSRSDAMDLSTITVKQVINGEANVVPVP